MSTLDGLTHEDKVFLAGSIQAIILADGNSPTPSELADLEKIFKRLDFQDYEDCLEDFEGRIDDEKAFLKAAMKVKSAQAQDVILRVIYELSLQNGLPNDSQESMERKLRTIWERPK